MGRRYVSLAIVFCVVLETAPRTASALTGNDWKAMDATSKGAYVAGVIEAWEVGGVDTFRKLVNCVVDRKMTGKQLVGTVDRYIASVTPTQRRQGQLDPMRSPMTFVMQAALTKTCE
jgi:hypothetical protein